MNYFLELDARSGTPCLAQMVSEGIEVPGESELSKKMKNLAGESLKHPPKITEEEIRAFRYEITDLINDIRAPRSKAELTGSGTMLYDSISEYYFRTNNLWWAKGKTISRKLQKHNPEFYSEFTESFEELFVNGRPEKIIELAENLLEEHGGFAFDGIRLDAPPEWKKNIK